MKNLFLSLSLIFLTTSLSLSAQNPMRTFREDMTFLNKYLNTVELKSEDGNARIVIIPEYQGRVMTSTSGGKAGKSYGWINYDLISSGEILPHMNAFGGEDRFWLGPEGGQYSIFFPRDAAFTAENWQTPPAIDSEPFELVERGNDFASFSKSITLVNYQGFTFEIDVNRKVSLLSTDQIQKDLGLTLNDELKVVGYQSDNQITNTGTTNWREETGLLSIWILGMYNPSPATSVIIPYQGTPNINTSYFGKIGDDRLKVSPGFILFKGDGKYRSKMGLPPENVTGFMGSYDHDHEILTLVKYSYSNDAKYVNSLWEIQHAPFEGDVINSYNDGPMENGEIMGPFYELESSSPALTLGPGQQAIHIHATYHLEGPESLLNEVAEKLLNVKLINTRM